MSATRLGLSTFLFGVLFDIASVRNVPRLKPWLMLAMGVSQVLAVARLAASSPRLPVPPLLRRLCVLASPLALLLMFYSLFVEVPLRKAWIEEGHTDELVTDGTYALTRHPGVLWYGLWLLTTALASRSRRLLTATPLLVLGDAVYVAFQERFVLLPTFGATYREYRATTPMLVPNRLSIRRFLAGLQTRRKPSGAPPA